MTRFVANTITFPYKRSLGPVVGAFMTALTEKRILGIRNGEAVLVPPMEWDPATGAELEHDFVEVGPAGTVDSWTWVPTPSEQHPLAHPFAFAMIRLDGATTPLLHAVDAGSPGAIEEGTRVAPGGAAPGWAGSTTSSVSCRVKHPKPKARTPVRQTSRLPAWTTSHPSPTGTRSPMRPTGRWKRRKSIA